MTRYGWLLGIVAALAIPAASAAAPATTQPSKAVLVDVNITDHGIRTAMFHTDGPKATDYYAAYYAMRGEVAYFVVRNKGRRPHDFTVLGKKTKTLRPGGSARFHVTLLRRGAFTYRSTLDGGKKGFRGVFTVA